MQYNQWLWHLQGPGGLLSSVGMHTVTFLEIYGSGRSGKGPFPQVFRAKITFGILPYIFNFVLVY